MKQKLVLHVVTALDFGGVESHMSIIGCEGKLSRFQHKFCAISEGGAVAEAMMSSNVPVSILGRKSTIPSFPALVALLRHITYVSPDIIHCHGAEANFHGIIAGKLCRVPVCIAEEIGIPNHSNKAQIVFRYIYRLADSVVAISEAVKREIVKMKEVEAEQCHVLLNPTRMLAERCSPPPSDQFRIGFVGRLEAVKNPLGLIKAVGLLRDRGLPTKLTIVGDGSQRKLLELEVEKLKLSATVTFAGFQSRPFDMLTEIDLYIQPSISEGFGLALVEAMSMGIPVLAAPVGGAPEFINHDVNGWLLEGTAPEEIAASIQKCMLCQGRTLFAIGACGRNSVIERFSPATYFSSSDSLYEHLLELKGA